MKHVLVVLRALAAGIVLFGVGGVAHAESSPAFTLSLDGGVNFFNNGDGTGGGFNVYPGLDFGTGLVPELQLGLHGTHTTVVVFENGSVSSRLYLVPIYVGGRYEMSDLFNSGPIKPFIGLHLGVNIVRVTNASGVAGIRGEFGFNVGVGMDCLILPELGVGASLWYDIVNSSTTADNAWLSLGVNARYHFGFDTAPQSP